MRFWIGPSAPGHPRLLIDGKLGNALEPWSFAISQLGRSHGLMKPGSLSGKHCIADPGILTLGPV